jgi:XRE family aerobic/anaerobic benzoate catabolism transcriptional regulator
MSIDTNVKAETQAHDKAQDKARGRSSDKAGETPVANPPAGRNKPGNGKANGRPCGVAEAHESYLKMLGDRVRNARARRGVTRKTLSRDSGVSERYLAQLEAGQGNISIGLLRQVAHAMNMALADLVYEGPERPVELTLLLEHLSRLGPAELSQAHDLLVDKFGPGNDRADRIAMIGLRGAGKTTLGRLLAENRNVPFIQLAKEIENDAGMSMSEIFSLSGQAAYRRHERRVLERLVDSYSSAVIEVGGSLVSEAGTFDLLLSTCFTVWLQASPEEHMNRVIGQGDTRPMAGNSEAMDDLRRILSNREALYAKANAVLNTSQRSVDACFVDLSALCPPARTV